MRRHLIVGTLALSAAGCATISTQQEVQLGQQYSQQVEQQLPIIHDPEVSRYINVLGDSIAKLSDDRNLEWHFFVVDSKEVNAFAIPGGFVYVNRGLIERSDRMDQLAGVLGHEIGHVINRHSVKQMQKAQNANIGVTLACVLTRVCGAPGAGTLINAAGAAVFSKFSRDDETQADESGVGYVVRAGIDPRGMPEMFQKLLEERKAKPAGVDAWFATHPLEESRIADTDRLIAKIDPAILGTLTQDTPNFHAFKDRILSMPPSPPPRSQ
jgi:predicted Zn-dependent protease